MRFNFLQTKEGKLLKWTVFLVYLALLTKVILFKYPFDMIVIILKSNEILPLGQRIANSNFIPMKTILNYLFESPNVRISMINILGNIIAFLPLGFLLPILFNRINKLKSVMTCSAILSLFFEMVQLLTAIGSFDVDDILLNVFGSFCGYMIYRWIQGLLS